MTLYRMLKTGIAILISSIVVVLAVAGTTTAQVQNPQSGGVGVQGKISAPPPTSAPTISSPTNGQVLSSIPVEVRGICTGDLLVKLYKNNVF
jgi:hypothetical protein